MCSAILYCNPWTNGWQIMRANPPVNINLTGASVLLTQNHCQQCFCNMTTTGPQEMAVLYLRSWMAKAVRQWLFSMSIFGASVGQIRGSLTDRVGEAGSCLHRNRSFEHSGWKLSGNRPGDGVRSTTNCIGSRDFILLALLKQHRQVMANIVELKTFDKVSTTTRQRLDKVSTSEFDKHSKQSQIEQGVEMILSTLHKKCTKTLKHRHTNTQDYFL